MEASLDRRPSPIYGGADRPRPRRRPWPIQSLVGGVGRHSRKASDEDPDLIKAGKQTISELPRSAYFGSEQSFALIRGGRIDLAVLGAMEVSEGGDMANWMIPGKMIKDMGGAMDLVAGVKQIIVVMDHNAKNGRPKFILRCTLPLTGRNVDMVVTDLCVFRRRDHASPLHFVELASGITSEDVASGTKASFRLKSI